MELTPEEERIIKDHRKAQNTKRLMAFSRLTVLRIAYQYEEWLQGENAGSTYSTFCDDFCGYTGVNRSVVFEQVEKLRKMAHDLPYITLG